MMNKLKFNRNKWVVKFFIASLLLLAINCYALTSAQLNQKIQQVTNNYLQKHGLKHGFTAVEVSVLLPNETKTRNYAAGTVSKQSQKLATTKMFLQYGSNTKMFTSSLIIKLIDMKIINYNTTLATIFPEKFTAKNSNAWPLAWKSITIKQLLNMTSGIQIFLEHRTYGQK